MSNPNRKIYFQDQGNITAISQIKMQWFTGINKFFTGMADQLSGGYSDLFNRSQRRYVDSQGDYVIGPSDFDKTFVSAFPTGSRVVSLPEALPGLAYWFRCIDGRPIEVQPTGGTDGFFGLTIGTSLTSTVDGSLMLVMCNTVTVWDTPIKIGTWV